ncbi:MAG: DUF5916 domain-containing protein [Vicinamibacterales bacterium]
MRRWCRPGSRLALVLGAVALPLLAARGSAQAPAGEPVVPEKAGKEFHALRITGAPPVVDGVLDDDVWTRAEAIDDFVQNEPDNMAPPRDRTVVQIAYDDRTLYAAVRCFTKDPSLVTTGLGRRDNLPPSDLIRMSFDTRHDHQNAVVFETNPSGMQNDYLFYEDTRQSPDFDAVWNVRTTIAADGWFAEYAIPFSQLRFTVRPGERTVWGFNLRRDHYRAGGYDRWVPTPRGAAGFVSRFGHLVFEQTMAPPRRIEILPVALARAERPAEGALTGSGQFGLDARLGLGTSATLSATLNPDFGQVEQDPAVLNLTVFENFFPERRPFFVEDSRMFVPPFPVFLPFHSRRIGRAPGRLALRDGDVEISRPEQTTILGAAKVTGRKDRWVYGGITALTAPEYAVVDAPVTSASGETVMHRTERLVEARTLYGVGRLRRDSRNGQSNVGLMATSVVRDGDADAFTGAADFSWRWASNKAQWTGLALGTYAPVDGRQQSGLAAVSNLSYDAKHIGLFSHVDRVTPTFRNSDLGFLGARVDRTNVNVSVSVRQPDPRGIFRSQGVFLFGQRSWNQDRLVFDSGLSGGIDLVFRNFSGLFVQAGHDFRRLDDLDSRGGPPIVKPGGWQTFLGLRSDSRKTWQVFLNNNLRTDEAGTNMRSTNLTLRVQPTGRLQVSVAGSYDRGHDAAQWIENTDATGDGETDHVYGRLERHVVSLTGRGTFAFTRDMTLEAYLQPFVAVGDYTDIRRLARPSSFDFAPVTLADNPDFNTKSLRSNVVFRWEYKRGSTFYAVWNLSAADEARPGVFSAGRDLADAFRGRGTHVFILKLTYWLGL